MRVGNSGIGVFTLSYPKGVWCMHMQLVHTMNPKELVSNMLYYAKQFKFSISIIYSLYLVKSVSNDEA